MGAAISDGDIVAGKAMMAWLKLPNDLTLAAETQSKKRPFNLTVF